MRDRLIELIRDRCKYEHCLGKNDLGICKNSCEATTTLADHLLAEGVIVPLCKVGDTVYLTDGIRIYELEMVGISWRKNKPYYETESIDFDDTAIGKSIFLTREEAEKALERSENGKS